MTSRERIKSVFSFCVRIGLSLGLLGYLFTKIDVKETVEVLRTADWTYLVYAGGLFLVINVVLLMRWFIFIRALDLTASVGHVIRYYLIGLFGNLFLPSAVGGDLIKVIGLCKNSAQKPKVVASVLLDRLSGFAGIVVVAVAAFVIGYRWINESSLIIPIVAMGIFSAVFIAVLFIEKVYSFCCRIFDRLPKFKKSLMDLHYDVVLLKENSVEGVKAVGLSCVTQSILAVTFFLTAKALGQDIPMIYFLVFVPIMCVAASFPSIGGLGVREAGAAYLFAKVGVDSGIAVSMSLINFLFMVVVGLIGGIVYVSTLSSRWVQHSSSDARVSGAG